mgnify:CR=1 FL=1
MSGLMDIFAHLEQEGVQLSSIINGAAVKSPLPAMPKINPATGTVIASIEPASPEMLDDAVRYAMMLEDEGYPEMHVIEIEDEVMVKTCEMHGYQYTVITPDDIVIPPNTEHDFI